MKSNISLISLHETLIRRKKSRATHYRDQKAGLFTLPVHVGRRSIAWPCYEVDQLISAQIAGVDVEGIRKLVEKLMRERRELKLEALDER
jgi:prophage regulatory protein